MKELTRKQMQIWLIVLSALLGLALVGGMVAVATLRSDIDQLDRQLAGGWEPEPSESESWSEPADVPPAGNPTGRIQDLAVTTDTFTLTVSVQLSGPGDLLFEPPVLRGSKTDYRPTQASLEQARYDFLDLVTAGQAVGTFVFRPAPVQEESLTLVFNPNHQPADPVAPKWQMVVRD